jgi:hypothetical protein
MKHLIAILLLNSLLLCGCENWPYRRYSFCIQNNSKYTIRVHAATSANKGVYPDTTLYTIESNDMTRKIIPFSEHFSEFGASPEEIFSYLPKDTLSVYIFCQDTLDSYSWEEIQYGYKILRRYDLSIEDIKMLYNKNNVPKIPYPPDERMKHMKMYPPYEK